MLREEIPVQTLSIANALPELTGVYPLTPADVAAYRRDGHLKLRGVFTPDELSGYRPHLKRCVEENYSQAHGMEQKVAGAGKNWMFVNNLWTLDESAKRFVLSERLGRIAAELLGVPSVRLFRDQSYFKGPDGANTPWHQDAWFMPLDTDKVVTMWIPLTDITPDLAPMSYVTGSNNAGYLGTSMGDDASMDRFEDELRAKGFSIHNYGSFDLGDIAVHSAWTLHSSRSNTSPRMREALVVVYYADGAKIIDDPPLDRTSPPQEFYARMIRQQNRDTSLPGLRSGDLAAGPMVPVVWQSPLMPKREFSTLGFDDIIAPIPREQFFAEYWEKKPLVTRGRVKDFWTPLFSMQDVDKAIVYTRPTSRKIEVVTEEGFVRDNYLYPDGTANLTLVRDIYMNGSTLLLGGLEREMETLAVFASNLERALSHMVAFAIYLTPPNFHGVRAHYDTQENFLLQVEGTKRWRVYPPVHELPPVEGSYRTVEKERLGPALIDTVLEPGDALYIPRGFVHEGEAGSAASLHITVDVHVRTWEDFLKDTLMAVAQKDARFRRSLPTGFIENEEALAALGTQFRELVDAFASSASVHDGVWKHAEDVFVRKQPVPDGHFASLHAEIGPQTKVTKRRMSLTRVFAHDGVAGIQFTGNQIIGPPKIEAALRFVAANETFTPSQLPGLGENEQLVLTRRLVRTGLLTVG
jgi:lysine-specific demethylase/histidyl-hydroxylase NO66